MKASDLLESRRENWRELESLCSTLSGLRRRTIAPTTIARFASLYRSACADLALADTYQLPPDTIHYLHQLVGRAHSQLYRSRQFRFRTWLRTMLVDVPKRLYSDGCLRLAMVLFWGTFVLAGALAYTSSDFAESVVTREFLQSIEMMHSGRDHEQGVAAAYIYRNGSIGLQCFGFGLVFGVGGLFLTVYNAAVLGVVFGHMASISNREPFFQFVTAHGPFELTAIALMAGAGMRLGFSLVATGGLARSDSLRLAAKRSVPVMSAGVILFVLAAGIEAFLSCSEAPYVIKAGVAIASTVMLVVYFLVLGYPGEGRREELADWTEEKL